MQTLVLSAHLDTTFSVTDGDILLVLAKDVLLSATGDGIVAPGHALDRSIVVDGTISAGGSGVVLRADTGGDLGSVVVVSETGSVIAAGAGIFAATDALDFTNRGTIEGRQTGVAISGTGSNVVNEGTIRSQAGSALDLSGSAAMVVNNGALSGSLDVVKLSGDRTVMTNSGTIGAATGTGVLVSGIGSFVTNNKTIGAKGHGLFATGAAETITNNGKIGSGGTALVVKGTDAIVTNAGALNAGGDGVALFGAHGLVTNNSTVEVGGVAIRIASNDAVVTNNDTLKGATGILVTGANAQAGNSGSITGWKAGAAAVDFSNAVNGAFNNKGEVTAASGLAFKGGAGKQALTNSGTLKGNVDLGDGDDYFNGTGGKVAGYVAGGAGNDTFVIDNAKTLLVESKGGGVDSIQSSVNYTLAANFENLTLTGSKAISATGNAAANQIHGNDAGNIIDGKAGNDVIWGHRGNDRLTGGAGADQFVFATGDGRDTITDFAAKGRSHDVLDLTGLASITSFSDLKAHHMTQSGGNVLIDGLNGDSILLSHVKLAQLDKGDFYFL